MTRRAASAAAFAGPLLGLAVLGTTVPRQSHPERAILGRWESWSTAAWRALPVGSGHPQAVLVATVVALVLFWSLMAAWLWWRPEGHRWLTPALVAWVAPFALGAPSFSRDIYSYVAQGELLRRGLDPYVHPVAALGAHSSVLLAADPVWRTSLTPYGPLALRLEELAATAGMHDELLALVFLRLVSVVCLIALVVIVGRCVPRRRRDLARWLVCSPLVLVHGVSPAHLELPVALLLVCAALLAQKHTYLPAAVLVVFAGEIKATAFIALGVLAVHALAVGRGEAIRCLAAGAATLAVSCLLYVRDPFGWLSALGTPSSHWDPYTPSSVLLLVLGEARHHTRIVGPAGVGAALRVLTVVGGAGVALWLLRRSRRSAARATALVMLVLLLSAPVLWPWYLVPCAVLLLLGQPRDWYVSAAIGGSAALVALPIKVVPAQRVAVVAVGLAVLVAALMRRRAAQGAVLHRRRPAAQTRLAA